MQAHKTLTNQHYLNLFKRYLSAQWRKAIIMALLLLTSIGLQLLQPQILRYFIDAARDGVATTTLTRAALLFLAIALITQVFNAIATYLGADVGWSATNLIRRDLAKHTLNLDMSFHNDRTAGEMIERIDGDVTALSDFFSQFSVRVFGALLLLIGILVILYFENPWVGLALSLFTALELFVLARTRQLAVPATRLEREANAGLFGFIEERLAGIEDIRANGAGEHAMHRMTLAMREFFRVVRRAWMMRSVIWLTSYGLFVLGISMTLAACIYFVLQGRMTVGTGYLIVQYMFMLLTPIDQITQQMQTLQRAGASISRINALFDMHSSLPAGRGVVLPGGALSVSFDGVRFSYDDKAILKDVSFELPAGRTLGLLGRTGSGKTTLTRLLFRFYDPVAGAVFLNGVNVADIAPASLRQQVGFVTQEVQLFQASVRDNVRFFDTSIDDVVIKDVLDTLGLSAWLASLPDGLDTELSASGGNLSSGEAQLLAFARVFLKNPGLIILDEPSSRLDPATEKRLEQALATLLKGRTAIIIAHRLATVEQADDIMILEDGQILEYGTRASLRRNPDSRFAGLLRQGGDLDTEMEVLS